MCSNCSGEYEDPEATQGEPDETDGNELDGSERTELRRVHVPAESTEPDRKPAPSIKRYWPRGD